MAAAWTVQRGDGYAWGTCSLASRPGCHRRALALRASHVLRAEASVTLTISCSNAAFLLFIRGMRFGIRGMSSEEASVVWAEGRFEEGADEGDDQRT